MSKPRIRMLGALAVCLVLPLAVLGQNDGQGSNAQQADLAPKRFKVAAYNLENGFDVYDDPYTEDQTAGVKPRAQWKAIAEAIKQMDADIVAFSELENRQVLQSLVNTFLPKRGYDYIAVDSTNDGRGINLGMISRFPIRSVTSYRWRRLHVSGDTTSGDQKSRRFARDLMHARIRLPQGQANQDQANQDQPILNLFAVHFKSKRDAQGDKNATAWRTAEARMVRRIVGNLIEEKPNSLALVVGDLNANPSDPAAQILLKPGPSSSVPPLLSDLHDALPTQQRITYPSERYPNTIFDYILASPAMERRYIQGSAGLIREKNLTSGSDHRPVFASFRIADTDR